MKSLKEVPVAISKVDALRSAYYHAWNRSDDLSTKCGAYLCEDDLTPLCYGANTYPPGIDPALDVAGCRDRKLMFIEHAERDVIYTAAKVGLATEGLIMVCPWACCCDCGRAIVQAGIKKVIAHEQAYRLTPMRWVDSITTGIKILHYGGVEYELVDATIGGVQALFNGHVWKP